MLLSIGFIIAGLVILTYSSNWLVDGASALARRLQVSDLVIGLTIVSLGTSAPELVVNLFASLNGNTDLAIANILGSNIFNVLLIIGVSALIYPIKIYSNTIYIEIPLTVLAALMVGICANDFILDGVANSQISRSDGLALLGFFAVFMYYSYYVSRKDNPEPELNFEKLMPLWKSIILVLAGLAGLVLGGKLMVDGAVDIARTLGISESVIGITIVATGTSLPELAASVVAALKRKTDIAIGNVVGSNIFNAFFILGVSSTIRPLPFNESSNIDILVTVLASLLFFLFAFLGRKRTIYRTEGVVLVSCYVIYIGYLLYYQVFTVI